MAHYMFSLSLKSQFLTQGCLTVLSHRLMEADYRVVFRIPSNVNSDGFPSAQFPLYGGSVTTPDSSTVIVIEYVSHTWRLPKVGSPTVSMPLPQKSLTSSLISDEDLSDIVMASNVPTCNSFSSLPEVQTLVMRYTCPLFFRTNALKDAYNSISKICVDSAKELLLFIAHTGIPIIGQYS